MKVPHAKLIQRLFGFNCCRCFGVPSVQIDKLATGDSPVASHESGVRSFPCICGPDSQLQKTIHFVIELAFLEQNYCSILEC